MKIMVMGIEKFQLANILKKLKNRIFNLQNSDTFKSQLTTAINFISLKNVGRWERMFNTLKEWQYKIYIL